ncbi:VOC family protein [Haloferula sp. BvORR071]|uniref:VOC family protein n=1 Tax=Haloferula sp. BvORR071 TaxID=1396141 RepID=UPI000698D8AC|nr:VOC family protein [Haloferula sp. BvORR071]
MVPRTSGITESALYVDDLARAVDFYLELLGGRIVRRDERFCAIQLKPEQVLLLFLRGRSVASVDVGFGTIIGHDGAGPLHVCFGTGDSPVAVWEQRLAELGIPLESRVNWPGGATSLYFRDPDGHAVELATPGLWESLLEAIPMDGKD